MNVLGLDQSLTSTGVVILGPNCEMLSHRAIDGSEMRGVERLAFIRDTVIQLVKLYDVKKVCMEGYAFMRFAGREKMGEVGGVLKMAFYDTFRMKPIVIAPSSLKKFVTGKGNAKKGVMLYAVRKNYGHFFETDDEADAFGLAMMAALIANSQAAPMTPMQQDIIETLRRKNE